jgi:hypothetical protein
MRDIEMASPSIDMQWRQYALYFARLALDTLIQDWLKQLRVLSQFSTRFVTLLNTHRELAGLRRDELIHFIHAPATLISVLRIAISLIYHVSHSILLLIQRILESRYNGNFIAESADDYSLLVRYFDAAASRRHIHWPKYYWLTSALLISWISCAIFCVKYLLIIIIDVSVSCLRDLTGSITITLILACSPMTISCTMSWC